LDQPTPIEKDNPLGMSARASYSDYWPTTSSKDKPHDECGVFGIHAPGQDVANVTYFGLYALQHRGQESAGITVSYGERLETIKDMGLVSQVFDDPHVLGNLRGNPALGHTRYSTTGSAKVLNAQPMVYDHPQIGPVAIGHNGNLTNYQHLRQEFEEKGVEFETSSDTEVMLRLIGQTPGPDLKTVLRRSLPRLEGAYSLVLLTRDSLVGVRDQLGFRPLCIGTMGDGTVSPARPAPSTPSAPSTCVTSSPARS
jgi:amidophosphoribosyltransferase